MGYREVWSGIGIGQVTHDKSEKSGVLSRRMSHEKSGVFSRRMSILMTSYVHSRHTTSHAHTSRLHSSPCSHCVHTDGGGWMDTEGQGGNHWTNDRRLQPPDNLPHSPNTPTQPSPFARGCLGLEYDWLQWSDLERSYLESSCPPPLLPPSPLASLPCACQRVPSLLCLVFLSLSFSLAFSFSLAISLSLSFFLSLSLWRGARTSDWLRACGYGLCVWGAK